MAPNPVGEAPAALPLRFQPRLPWPAAVPGPPVWRQSEMAWIVSRHAEIQTLLRSRVATAPDLTGQMARLCGRAGIAAEALAGAAEGFMLCQHGERHRSTREAVSALLPPLQDRWDLGAIADLAAELAGGGGTLDLVPRLTDPLPNRIAADMLGLHAEDVAWLRALGLEQADAWRPAVALRDYPRFEAAAARIRDFLENAERPGGTSPLRLEPKNLVSGVEAFLLSATIVTTSGTLGTAFLILAQLPDLQARIRAEPSLAPAFVEEGLRLGGGARRLSARRLLEPLELGGTLLPAGALVVADIEAASLDPAAYPEPEALALDRVAPMPLAFGGGRHPCVGARFARAQVVGAVRGLLERFELSQAGPPCLAAHPDLRCYTALPVRLEPIARAG